MDSRRLLILRDVVRAGSLSAAARELGWTQPAVSQHVARLERDAGMPLLVRGPGGVVPTEAGAVLIRRADAIAAELRAAEEEIGQLAQLSAGRVSLLAFPSAAATLVPDAVAALAADHPGVEVRFDEQEPPEAIAAVQAGDADLALVFGYDAAPEGLGALVWRALFEESMYLVAPRSARAADRAAGEGLAAWADADWVGGCARSRTHLIEVCDRAGFAPRIRYTTDDYVVVQNLVARGLGVTALPASALAAYRHPEVDAVPLGVFGRRRVGVIHRPGAEAVPASAALMERLHRQASAADGAP
ncbi:LysR family transcriptional regulator [Nocardioides sp. R-C-SC26]|uniref:LysR family transcriptional regulator n=1 Tax=Nocardioides sp. R-C-SC26 TaxID=2870414 RepID=UPI001E5CA5F3|nr:LysR family transcriptional regulator [Nocardioides sp. R-C-SC26]